jgi:hypothetical protein
MLYDEPTTGLDPITSTTITDLIVKARDLDRVSSILVTHQLRDAFNVARTRVEGTGDDARLTVAAEGQEPGGPSSWCCARARWCSRVRPPSCAAAATPTWSNS